MNNISFFTDPSITYLMTDDLKTEEKHLYLLILEDITEKDRIYNSLILLSSAEEKYIPNPVKFISAAYTLITRITRRTYKIARKLIENISK